MDESRRQRFVRRLRIGLALLVGASMGLVALNGNADTVVAVGALVAGTAVGAAVAWWLVPDDVGKLPDGRRRGPRR